MFLKKRHIFSMRAALRYVTVKLCGETLCLLQCALILQILCKFSEVSIKKVTAFHEEGEIC